MPLARPALFLLLVLSVAGCDIAGQDAEPTPTAISLTASDRAVLRQSNDFGVRLFARTAAETEGNLMLSPLSASTALTMLLNGADGETYAQIHDMLGYTPGQDLAAVNESYRSLRTQLLAADQDVTLALANAVFHRQGFVLKTPFLATMRETFDASVQGLDFANPAAAVAINRWASDHTNGRVPRVIDEIEANTVLYLMDALYFKGEWSAPFDPTATRPAGFQLAGGTTVQVPMMNGRVPGHTAEGDGYTAVELPYGRRNFSLVALMPDDGSLGDFAARLEAGLWTDATTRLDAQSEWTDVDVQLPRFRFSYEKTLNDQLEALGMVDAFHNADLSRMSDAGLSVSYVQQNTFVEVNEQGTEAAAVTTVAVEVMLGPHFFATRPFVFAIRERTTGALLFIGQVANPAA